MISATGMSTSTYSRLSTSSMGFARVRAFTLMEIMLVLVIMGIATSFVMFNAFSGTYAQDLEKQVKRFQVVFDLASDFAVLNQLELGLRIDQKKNLYMFMVLDEEDKWQPIEGDKALSSHELPEMFNVELTIDNLPWVEEGSLFDDGVFDEKLSFDDERVEIGKEEEKRLPPPQVFLLSSGEITPFSLTFIYEPQFGNDEPVYYRINGMEMPPVEREGPLDIL